VYVAVIPPLGFRVTVPLPCMSQGSIPLRSSVPAEGVVSTIWKFSSTLATRAAR
jgi:hypothetical protein